MKSFAFEPENQVATPSSPQPLGLEVSVRLRQRRHQLIQDHSISGVTFGALLSAALDEALVELAANLKIEKSMAIVAAGSYARRELAPGSDIDVLLIHDRRSEPESVRRIAEALWYPLWDAGFVLGHGVRTKAEALALAQEDLDALTALLEIRFVAGNSTVAAATHQQAKKLARRKRKKILTQLVVAAANRADHPGPIAEMLEPNLKDGAGGLRDIDALSWAAACFSNDSGGLSALVDRGALEIGDREILAGARTNLLDARLALHRVTGTSSDVLTLQEQDAVAEMLTINQSADPADDLIRSLAESARAVTWITSDAWRRVGSRPRRSRRPTATQFSGISKHHESIVIDISADPDTPTALRAAVVAAKAGLPLERSSLERLRTEKSSPMQWDVTERGLFVELLQAGPSMISVVEALDQVGVMTALLPEWEAVRALPQRNAYHRFTVDRHLLECVAECADLLTASGFNGDIARRCRTDLLLLGALLHDIAKGNAGDHSTLGAQIARTVGERMGLDAHAIDVLSWLVQNHLLLADTATRRDLADEETIVRFGRAVGDTERLDLLYALTISDSKATGPAAWSSGKAALVRQLFIETDVLFESGVTERGLDAARMTALARYEELLATRVVDCSWGQGDDGLLECAVVAPDQRGLLAKVAEVLAVHRFDVRVAAAYQAPNAMALEVYRGVDTMGRLDEIGRQALKSDLEAVISGQLDVKPRLAERRSRALRKRSLSAGKRNNSVRVAFDVDASRSATVVEIEAPDESGLLARVAGVFRDLDFDVSAALVSTLGDRVVDTFYLRDSHGAKPTDPAVLEELKNVLETELNEPLPSD